MRRASAGAVAALLLAGAAITTLFGPAGRAAATHAAVATPTVTAIFVSVERTSAKLVHKRDFEAVCACHSSYPADDRALIWVVGIAGNARFDATLTHASGYVMLTWPDLRGGGGGFNSVDAWPRFWSQVTDLAWG